MKRAWIALCAAAAAAIVVTSCGDFEGLNSYPLPFTEGGDDGYTVTVEMANAVNLVPNSEVKVRDLTVGSVREIEVEDWRAQLTVSLNGGVDLPANAVARIGQKSLLGAEYLELAVPDNVAPRGKLRDGDVIPLSATGRYPETEEVLTAMSLLLNGGGLDQVQTITSELNNALGGRAGQVRSLLTRLDTFVSGLDAQRSDIVRLLDNFDRLSSTLAEQNDIVSEAVDIIPEGLETLNAERDDLVQTMAALADVSEVVTRVLDTGGQELVTNLRKLQPTLRELADAGKDLPESIGGITPLFPLKTVTDIFKGDFINFFVTLDLTSSTLLNNFLSGTPLESLLGGGPLSPPLAGAGTEGKNPLTAPLPGMVPAIPPPVKVSELLDPVLPEPSDTQDPAPSTPPEQPTSAPASSARPADAGGLGGLLDALPGGG